MRTRRIVCAIPLQFAALVIGSVASSGAQIPAANSAPLPSWTAAVDAALGRHGTMNPGGVYKFGFPRSDLHVTLAGVTLKPALALGSWLAFKAIRGDSVMVMGDVVLGVNEVEPVMASLQNDGVTQTALHNHLIGESPRIMYMHIMAMGDATRIARTLRKALALSGTPLAMTSGGTMAPTPMALDTAAIARIIGHAGTVNGGVYQIGVARGDTIRALGESVPPAMGTATALNFQPTGNATAAITGDFVLLASEVNPVIRALRAHQIDVTAVHNHMLDDTPHLLFLHFWANGDALSLARGLRAALDAAQ